MKRKMSRWGIGPIFGILSIMYLITMLVVSYFYKPLFEIEFLPRIFVFTLGIVFLVIGVPFYVASVNGVTKAYNSNKLVTSGVFRYCRHPLYSSWIVFIVPAIVLLSNSLIGLTTPIFMYLILLKLIKKEEAYLESIFDSDYLEYKKNVPCILPYGFMNKM